MARTFSKHTVNGIEYLVRDLKAKEDTENLQNAIGDYYDSKMISITPNLYNKNNEGIKPGYYGTGTGWTYGEGNEHLGATHPLYLIQGKTYKWKNYGIYGNNAKYAFGLRIPGDGAIVDMSNVGVLSDGYYTVEINRTGWYVIDIDMADKDNCMICEKDNYPDKYMPYGIAKMAEDYPNVFLSFDNDGTPAHISIAEYSANLFNKDDAGINDTRWASTNGWNNSGSDERLGATHNIYLEAGKTYKWKGAYNVYGDTNSRTAWQIRYPGDGEVIALDQIGSWTDSTKTYITLTCTRSGYYVVDIDMREIDTFMFCELDRYPSYYAEYGALYAKDTLKYDNINSIKERPIKGKTLICDGDSIASATPDSPEGKGGWFGRLQMNQQIVGTNYAVGGGSITYLASDRHCISRSMDNIYDDYPEIDYLILEGGTNDADLIGQFVGDTPPEGFGTWTENDYSGEYDDTTFCGAVESMFYKAVTYWPNAQIGFIIAMEMGHNNNASTNNRKRYFDEIEKIAKKWHIPVLNLWDNSGADARLTAFYDPTKTNQQNIDSGKFYYDGQHPTSYGYNKMQPIIEEWVKGL